MLLVLVIVPVAGGIAAWLAGDRHPATARVVAAVTLVATIVAAISSAITQPSAALRWGDQLELGATVVDVARPVVVLIPFVGAAVVTYASTYGSPRGRARMLGLLVAFLGVMELLVTAGDFVTLLVAWELVGLISWALIAHHWTTDAPARANEAFVATRFGDLGLFVAAGMVFAATGSFRLSALSDVHGAMGHAAVAGVLLAAIAKSAQLPFAPWLFAAMAGPTPASALLHSATMVAAGVFLVIRLQPSLDAVAWFAPVTIGVGLVTALAGGVVAALQPEAKKLLAASTSAHYGLMFVAVGAGYPTVAVAHLVAHGVFKAMLFMSVGAAIDASGSNDLADMRLRRELPVVAALTAVGSFALAGVPPLGAAWTKEQITAAASDRAEWLGIAVVVAGALSAFYATRFQLLAYGRGDIERTRTGRSSPMTMTVAALATLAVASVALGVWWLPWGHRHVVEVVGGTLPATAAWELVVSLVAIAVAMAVAVGAHRRGRLTEPVPWTVAPLIAGWFGLPALTRRAVVDPVLAVARGAARLDDRLVDAGIAHVAGGFRSLSSSLAGLDDRVVDAGVRGTAVIGRRAARLLDQVAELSFDGVVSDLADVTGRAGRAGRRLQSGRTQQYYAGLAAGLALLVLVLIVWS